jgi:hypothetical protein
MAPIALTLELNRRLSGIQGRSGLREGEINFASTGTRIPTPRAVVISTEHNFAFICYLFIFNFLFYRIVNCDVPMVKPQSHKKETLQFFIHSRKEWASKGWRGISEW